MSDFTILLYRIDEARVIHQLGCFQSHLTTTTATGHSMDLQDGLIDIDQWELLLQASEPAALTVYPYTLLEEIAANQMFMQVYLPDSPAVFICMLYDCSIKFKKLYEEHAFRRKAARTVAPIVRLTFSRYVIKHLPIDSPDLMEDAW